jgi:hypothetical protein
MTYLSCTWVRGGSLEGYHPAVPVGYDVAEHIVCRNTASAR